MIQMIKYIEVENENENMLTSRLGTLLQSQDRGAKKQVLPSISSLLKSHQSFNLNRMITTLPLLALMISLAKSMMAHSTTWLSWALRLLAPSGGRMG